MYERVLVPLDGSTLAERAIAHAERLVAPGGEIILAGVVQPELVVPGLGAGEAAGPRELEAAVRAMREALERPRLAVQVYLADATRRVARSDVTVTTRVLEGHPVDRLVQAAGDVDLIVMSTHGRTGLRRAFIGSVAERVVRHAPVPVLVVR